MDRLKEIKAALESAKNFIGSIIIMRGHDVPEYGEVCKALSSIESIQSDQCAAPPVSEPMKMVSNEWLRKKIEGHPDMECEADILHPVKPVARDEKTDLSDFEFVELEPEIADGFNGEHFQYKTGRQTIVICGVPDDMAHEFKKMMDQKKCLLSGSGGNNG